MKRFQWKWIFTGSKTCCTILRPFRIAMVAILNPKWPPKYKNPPIGAKFGFQVDYDVANWYPNCTWMLSTMSRCADYFRNFQNGHRCHGNHKNHKKFKVLGIGWNFPEIFSDMCTHNFEAYKFQNGRRCQKKRARARNWMKLNRNVVWHVYKWFWGLEISKCLPLPWKPQKHSI